MKYLDEEDYQYVTFQGLLDDDLADKILTMSNTLRKIEELAQLWRTQAESYKEQDEANNLVPLGTAAAATVHCCAKELEEILNG